MINSNKIIADYYTKKQSLLGVDGLTEEIEKIITKHGAISSEDIDLDAINKGVAKLIDDINNRELAYYDENGNLDGEAIINELNAILDDNDADDSIIRGTYAAELIGWCYEKSAQLKARQNQFMDAIMANPIYLSVLKDAIPNFSTWNMTEYDDIMAIVKNDFSSEDGRYQNLKKILTDTQLNSIRSSYQLANADIGKTADVWERIATFSKLIEEINGGTRKIFDEDKHNANWAAHLHELVGTTDILGALDDKDLREKLEGELDQGLIDEYDKLVRKQRAMHESGQYKKQSLSSQKYGQNVVNWFLGAVFSNATERAGEAFDSFMDKDYKSAGHSWAF